MSIVQPVVLFGNAFKTGAENLYIRDYLNEKISLKGSLVAYNENVIFEAARVIDLVAIMSDVAMKGADPAGVELVLVVAPVLSMAG